MKLFDLKRFAINDGPGIRTTVFLKGCPLHCLWCHNPEGIDPKPEKLYIHTKCIGCRTCIDTCPQDALTLTPQGIAVSSQRCTGCNTCTSACPTLALENAGREWTLQELMEEIEKERLVMETSNGGVTLCGGEPLMQRQATLDILIELGHRHIHRALDTTLYCGPSVLQEILPHTDLFLIDIKHMDSAKHEAYTGVPNEPILNNIRFISQSGSPYWIRIPFIEGINADQDNLEATARFLSGLPVPPQQINLLPYHDIGKGKHQRLGTTYNPEGVPMSAPSEEGQQLALRIFQSQNLEVKIGG